jgi:zinc-binding alcohol dehydrogenase/oxidoreductase
MKAMQLVEFGDEPRFELHELPDPVPGPGEVVVDVVVAGLNRRDRWIWTLPGYCPPPVTMGSDAAGVLAAVGPGVTGWRPGDEVVVYPTIGWADGAELPGPDFDILGAPTPGTFAEKLLVPASHLAPRPHRLGWAESGVLPLGGLTAVRALFTCGRLAAGQRLLVTGAGGGVSTFVVSLAVAAGAHVVVTTGSEQKAARARELGARAAVLYTGDDWPGAVREAVGGELDLIVDSYGGESWTKGLALLRRGGVFVSFGDTGSATSLVEISDVYWEWRRILGTTMGSPGDFRELLRRVNEQSWRPVVDSEHPLERLSDAARRLDEPERFGKVAVRVSADPT